MDPFQPSTASFSPGKEQHPRLHAELLASQSLISSLPTAAPWRQTSPQDSSRPTLSPSNTATYSASSGASSTRFILPASPLPIEPILLDNLTGYRMMNNDEHQQLQRETIRGQEQTIFEQRKTIGRMARTNEALSSSLSLGPIPSTRESLDQTNCELSSSGSSPELTIHQKVWSSHQQQSIDCSGSDKSSHLSAGNENSNTTVCLGRKKGKRDDFEHGYIRISAPMMDEIIAYRSWLLILLVALLYALIAFGAVIIKISQASNNMRVLTSSTISEANSNEWTQEMIYGWHQDRPFGVTKPSSPFASVKIRECKSKALQQKQQQQMQLLQLQKKLSNSTTTTTTSTTPKPKSSKLTSFTPSSTTTGPPTSAPKHMLTSTTTTTTTTPKLKRRRKFEALNGCLFRRDITGDILGDVCCCAGVPKFTMVAVPVADSASPSNATTKQPGDKSKLQLESGPSRISLKANSTLFGGGGGNGTELASGSSYERSLNSSSTGGVVEGEQTSNKKSFILQRKYLKPQLVCFLSGAGKLFNANELVAPLANEHNLRNTFVKDKGHCITCSCCHEHEPEVVNKLLANVPIYASAQSKLSKSLMIDHQRSMGREDDKAIKEGMWVRVRDQLVNSMHNLEQVFFWLLDLLDLSVVTARYGSFVDTDQRLNDSSHLTLVHNTLFRPDRFEPLPFESILMGRETSSTTETPNLFIDEDLYDDFTTTTTTTSTTTTSTTTNRPATTRRAKKGPRKRNRKRPSKKLGSAKGPSLGSGHNMTTEGPSLGELANNSTTTNSPTVIINVYAASGSSSSSKNFQPTTTTTTTTTSTTSTRSPSVRLISFEEASGNATAEVSNQSDKLKVRINLSSGNGTGEPPPEAAGAAMQNGSSSVTPGEIIMPLVSLLTGPGKLVSLVGGDVSNFTKFDSDNNKSNSTKRAPTINLNSDDTSQFGRLADYSSGVADNETASVVSANRANHFHHRHGSRAHHRAPAAEEAKAGPASGMNTLETLAHPDHSYVEPFEMKDDGGGNYSKPPAIVISLAQADSSIIAAAIKAAGANASQIMERAIRIEQQSASVTPKPSPPTTTTTTTTTTTPQIVRLPVTGARLLAVAPDAAPASELPSESGSDPSKPKTTATTTTHQTNDPSHDKLQRQQQSQPDQEPARARLEIGNSQIVFPLRTLAVGAPEVTAAPTAQETPQFQQSDPPASSFNPMILAEAPGRVMQIMNQPSSGPFKVYNTAGLQEAPPERAALQQISNKPSAGNSAESVSQMLPTSGGAQEGSNVRELPLHVSLTG